MWLLFAEIEEQNISGDFDNTDFSEKRDWCIRSSAESFSIKDKCLDAHNYYRCLHGLKPLLYNDSLATTALRHVNLLQQKELETRNAFKVYMTGKQPKSVVLITYFSLTIIYMGMGVCHTPCNFFDNFCQKNYIVLVQPNFV